jgi:hypothetical protein
MVELKREGEFKREFERFWGVKWQIDDQDIRRSRGANWAFPNVWVLPKATVTGKIATRFH